MIGRRDLGADRMEWIALSGWSSPMPPTFEPVGDGVLEFFEATDGAGPDRVDAVAEDLLVVDRGWAAPGTETSAMSAARAWLAGEIADGRVKAGEVARRHATGRLELVVIRIARAITPLPEEGATRLRDPVTTEYRVSDTSPA